MIPQKTGRSLKPPANFIHQRLIIKTMKKDNYNYYVLEFPVEHNENVIWEDGGGFIAIDDKPILDDELIYAVGVDWRYTEYSRIYILVEGSSPQHTLVPHIKQRLKDKHGVTIGEVISRISKAEFDLNWPSKSEDKYATPFKIKSPEL